MRPPPRKAKLKAASKIGSAPDPPESKPKKKPTFENVFYGDEVSDSSDDASCGSDYGPGRKRKGKSTFGNSRKKRKTSYIRRSPTPEASAMSDCDYHDSDNEEHPLTFSKQDRDDRFRVQTAPTTLTLHVPRGLTTINLNVGDLLDTWSSTQQKKQGGDFACDTRSFSIASGSPVPSSSSTLLTGDSSSSGTNIGKANFLDLGPELRNRIYRLALVTETAIRFYPEGSGSRDIALLQTCHQVHNEARGILYGENSFHFDRVNEKRGPYYQKVWKEIGYKDIRRFLEDIGHINRSLMRYVSIDFSDACSHLTPHLEAHERRFVNDPVVLNILGLISSSGARLERFAVGFKGRQNVHAEDFYFLKAITGIRCQQLIHSFAYGNTKVNATLLSKMKEVMEIPAGKDVDEKRKKPTTKMLHEKPGSSIIRSFNW